MDVLFLFFFSISLFFFHCAVIRQVRVSRIAIRLIEEPRGGGGAGAGEGAMKPNTGMLQGNKIRSEGLYDIK